ncbi:MAG: YibE/F family protein [Ruminococcus sp.]|nr:YibE/F family protein [Ruminococcus sp.]
MKKAVLIVLLLLSAAALVFVYNDDFLYSQQIMKLTKIETVGEEISRNNLDLKEEHYTRRITGEILNGKDKGEKKSFLYDETYSSVVTDRFRVGDKVFIDGTDLQLKRDFYLALIVCLFVILIYIVGSFKGLLSVASVIINSVVFYIGLYLYIKGVDLLLLCVVEMLVFSVLSLILASGVNKKTLSAVISVMISTLFMLGLLMIVVKTTDYKGINFNELSFLTVPAEDIILPELLIGSVGAVMDVAITISSSMAELLEKNRDISEKELNKSAKEIGKDIMGTMSNVLFFTYLCAGLPVFVLAIRNGFLLKNYISSNFSLELSRFLAGSIGIVITIPISAFVSIRLMKRGGAK